jgi:hypothetical protein
VYVRAFQCDKTGGYKVIACPDDVVFNVETQGCGFTAPEDTPTPKTPATNADVQGRVATTSLAIAHWIFSFIMSFM